MSSSGFRHYTRDDFLAEFCPDPADKAAIAAGMEQLRAEQRAFRLAEMRRRLGITQGRVSAIEHAKPGKHRAAHPSRLRRSPRRPPGDHRRLRRPAARLHRTRHRSSLT